MRMAGPSIQFVPSNLTDEQLRDYYGNCRALLSMADEDFGITMAEALAVGAPVIGLRTSGALEIIKDGRSGILVGNQTSEDLQQALRKFDTMHFSPQECQENAMRFSTARFVREMKQSVDELVGKNS